MQFSLIAAAFMASVVSAGSTLYVTDVVTITSCAPTVTDCPAESTVTSTTSYIHTTSVPSYYNTTSVIPSHIETSTIVPIETHKPVETHKPTVPAHSLSTILVSTCVPTVITSIVTVYPTTTPTPVVPKPSTGFPTAPSGTHSPYPTFTGAASHVKGSLYVAGLGFAAMLFA